MNNIIPLNPQHKNIAVRLSGGPDSSILYYALCDFYKNDDTAKIYPYTVSTPLRPHSVNKAKTVVSIVSKLTGKLPTTHYTLMHYPHNKNNDVDTNSFEYTNGQELLEQRVIDECSLDAIYTGLSCNCPINELTAMVENCDTDKDRRRIALTLRDESRDMPISDTICNIGDIMVYMPFAHSNKNAVYQLYLQYGVVDELYPYTWSCENNEQITEENPTHCGVCYFCLERLYAFGKL